MRLIFVICSLMAMLPKRARAQDTAAVAVAPVVTIGSRVGERTSTKSVVPVDVVTAKSIESSGLAETWEILQRLIPTVSSAHLPRADDGTRPVMLRGLSPGQVLVLVNGKRLHNPAVIFGSAVLTGTAGNDVGSIPTIAIERIEILRDGAAAQYGSDAIAGVINIVLKTGTESQGRLSLGQVRSSEGGRTFADGNIAGAAMTYGVRIKGSGYATFSGELNSRGATNRAYPDQRDQYSMGDPRNSDPPVVRNEEGDGESHTAGFSVNAAIPIHNNSQIYFFGGATHRRMESASLFRRPIDATVIRAIHPDGFLPIIENGIDDVFATAGMRRSVRQWRWDISSTIGGNRFQYDLHDSNNASMGLQSPTDFYIGEQRALQWTNNVDIVGAAKMRNRSINIAAGGEFRIDTYGIRRGDSASYENGGQAILDGTAQGQLAAIGAQGMFGFQPIDEVAASRSSVAAYIDLESRLFPRLLVDGAARAERYSDFGGTIDEKFATRVDLFPGFALRGSIGTGFRAPSLNQSNFATTRSTFVIKDGVAGVYQIRTFPVRTAEAKVLGAQPLEPEQSLSLSAGIVFDRPSLPTVTIDYYDIRIDGRIVSSSEFIDSSVTSLLAAHGTSGVAGAQYFANAADTRTRGADIIARYATVLGREGILQLVGGYNQTRTRVADVRSTPPELNSIQATLFGRTQRGIIERAQPDRTLMLTTDYSFRRFTVDLHNQRFGKTALLDASDPASDQTVEPAWITDVGLSYKVGRRVTASASVANVFDVYPSEWIDFKDGVNATGLSIAGNSRYAVAISPFGANGRTIYLRLTYR